MRVLGTGTARERCCLSLSGPVWIYSGPTLVHSFYPATRSNAAACLEIVTFSIHKTKCPTCPATRGLNSGSEPFSEKLRTKHQASDKPVPRALWPWMLGQNLFGGPFVPEELRCTRGLGASVGRTVTRLC